jgi:hypothetical protein
MSAEVLTENDRSRLELQALGERLTDEQLSEELGDGWTAAAVFGHIGFWERVALLIFTRAIPGDTTHPILDEDITNDALLPEWRALAPRRAVELAVEGMAALDAALHAYEGDFMSPFEDDDDFCGVDKSGHRDAHKRKLEAHFPNR